MSKLRHWVILSALLGLPVAPLEAQQPGQQPAQSLPAIEAAAVPAPVDTPPPTPEQMPPVPPRVSFVDGRLSIVAENSTLGDVLNAVKKLTSASIEYPPNAGSERVFVYLGPGAPRDVLNSLLAGSKFDYVIVGSENDGNAVESVMVNVRRPGGATAPQPAFGAQRPFPMPRPQPEIPPENVEEDLASEPEPSPAPVQPGIGNPAPVQANPGMQPNQPGNPNQPQIRTPEQLLEELQRMQRQQQQQQQQQTPQQPR